GSPVVGRAALALHHLGVVALDEGDVGAARTWGDAGLAAALSAGDQFGTARVLQLFALIAAAEGHLGRAVRLGGPAAGRGRGVGGAGGAGGREVGGSRSARWDADFRRRLAVPTGGWGHTSYGAALAAGQGMTPEQAVADALEEASAPA